MAMPDLKTTSFEAVPKTAYVAALKLAHELALELCVQCNDDCNDEDLHRGQVSEIESLLLEAGAKLPARHTAESEREALSSVARRLLPERSVWDAANQRTAVYLEKYQWLNVSVREATLICARRRIKVGKYWASVYRTEHTQRHGRRLLFLFSKAVV